MWEIQWVHCVLNDAEFADWRLRLKTTVYSCSVASNSTHCKKKGVHDTHVVCIWRQIWCAVHTHLSLFTVYEFTCIMEMACTCMHLIMSVLLLWEVHWAKLYAVVLWWLLLQVLNVYMLVLQNCVPTHGEGQPPLALDPFTAITPVSV